MPSTIRDVDPVAASSDDRLKRLEDRFEALLAELRELKSGDKARGRQAMPMTGPAGANIKATLAESLGADISKKVHSGVGRGIIHSNASVRDERSVDAVSLTRTTYKLPPGKADEIAAFLKENLTDEIEVRVKDQAARSTQFPAHQMLIVTASAEDQAAIASFIRLLQTRGAPATKAEANSQDLPYPKDDVFDDGIPATKTDAGSRRRKSGAVAPKRRRDVKATNFDDDDDIFELGKPDAPDEALSPARPKAF